MTISGLGRIGQIAMDGNPTRGSSRKAAMVARGAVTGALDHHSSFCSSRIVLGLDLGAEN